MITRNKGRAHSSNTNTIAENTHHFFVTNNVYCGSLYRLLILSL